MMPVSHLALRPVMAPRRTTGGLTSSWLARGQRFNFGRPIVSTPVLISSLQQLKRRGRRGSKSFLESRNISAQLGGFDNCSGPHLEATAPSVYESDFLVIGSGIAGLSYALRVAEHGTVNVVSKDEAQEGSTRYAQGGVCAVLGAHDSVDSHVEDTIVAGDFLCDLDVVRMVCTEGTEAVLELARMGAEFTKNADGDLHLTREGGHTHHRIVHAADMTGREIQRALQAKANAHPNIHFFEHHLATDLVTAQVGDEARCLGLEAVDRTTSQTVTFLAASTLLATGGAGHVYPNTTNPPVATGDGIAIAARAQVSISNMEFMQFHPTSLYLDSSKPRGPNAFLITEAVRGEGGILLNSDMERFMPKYDDRAELAPRDVVARSIDHQLKSRGDPCVFLDISHKPEEELLSHFPNIAAECLKHGIDITRDPIPVVPAAHYTCGGVKTGLDAETSVPGLYACGEVACTGLHGANRLASNSLLEGLVYAKKAAAASIRDKAALPSGFCAAELNTPVLSDSACMSDATGGEVHDICVDTVTKLSKLRKKLQESMWDNAGIVRSDQLLRSALRKVQEISDSVAAILEENTVQSAEALVAAHEMRNLLTVSELVVVSALERKESRGLHYSTDYPLRSEAARHPTVVTLPVDLRPYLEPQQVEAAVTRPKQRCSSPKKRSASAGGIRSITTSPTPCKTNIVQHKRATVLKAQATNKSN